MKYVHLHTHSHYSLLDGLGKIDQLLTRAKELNMDSLALTDHGVMYGIIEFYEAAKAMDIKPILGVEAYIAPRRLTDKSSREDGKPYHLVLLAESFEGYRNLLKLVSIAHKEGYYYKPRIDKEVLKKYSRGLIATSACLVGEVPSVVAAQNIEKAVKIIKEHQEIFGKENFFLELQDHPELPEQGQVNSQLIDLAKKLKVPLVATNDIHYVKREDREPHEVLVCVQTGKTIDDVDRMTYDGDFSMRPPQEIIDAFSAVPEAISNTVEIARRCNVELSLGKEILPVYPVPKGKTDDELLQEMCQERLPKRYKEVTPTLKERLQYELETIKKMGFASYFLIVQDFVNYAKNKGILVGPGRGSAAGSLVTYLLNITDLDPIKYGLLFERFLNPDRIEMPDIDIDFADTHRHEVLEYVRKKYGDEKVAGIITFGTMAARAAVRDAGRALGMAYGEVDRVAKLVPPPVQGRHIPLKVSIEESDELKAVYTTEPATKRLLDMASKLEGTVRHASQHACAVVISRDPLTDYVPLQKAQKGDVEHVTQYAMGPVTRVGILKMDFLGLANLSIIDRALEIIEAVWGEKVDIHNIPLNDKKTFRLLAQGKTTGVFQLESSGMKRYIRDLKPTELEDIIAMVALYRPGPLQFIESFIKRKHGREATSYPHPLVQKALEPTYGFPIYQEQVIQIAKDMAHFTGGEADTLRKAMGKKKVKLMEEMKVKFLAGAKNNGVDPADAQKVFKTLEDFAAYGFNKSHAACYALIAYQTAYLKAHYPSAFMAALMTSDLNNNERIAIEIEEAEQMGIKILPPDVNESYIDFGVVVDKGVPIPIEKEEQAPRIIRFGLAAIKNVGLGVALGIVRERKRNGPFKSFADFISRCAKLELEGGNSIINKKTLEALSKGGALDALIERNRCLENMEQILKFATGTARQDKNQIDLFGGGSGVPEQKLELASATPADDKQKLAWEKELLGMYLSEHPLKSLSSYIATHANTIASLTDVAENTQVTVIGIITTIKKIVTKNGQSMAFVGLEDTTGSTELVLFPGVLEKDTTVWVADKIVEVAGRISTKDNAIKILVDKGQVLDTANLPQDKNDAFEEIDLTNLDPLKLNMSKEGALKAKAKNKLKEYVVNLPRGTKKDLLIAIKEILQEFEGDVPVILNVPQNGGFERIKTRARVAPSKELDEKLLALIHSPK